MKKQSLPALKRKLQIVFNKFIRLRDKDKSCISCGEFKDNKQAGHFYSVRMYDGLRFEELNAHGECVRCNLFDDMHLLNYAAHLPERIGIKNFEALEQKARFYKQYGCRWSRTEIEEMIKEYNLKIKNLKQ